MTRPRALQLVDVEVERPLPRTVAARPGGELDAAATEALEQVVAQQLDGLTPCRLVLDLNGVACSAAQR